MPARAGLYSALTVALLATAIASCGNESARDTSQIAPSPDSTATEFGTPTASESTGSNASSPPRSSETGTSTIPSGSDSWTPISPGEVPPTEPQTNLSSTRPTTDGPAKPTDNPPSKQTSTPNPPPPINSCGPAPSGHAPDGRSLQKIYFPDPGTNHQWPDRTVKLKACSTSGLPITYQLEDGGRGGSCHVQDPAANPLTAQGETLSCRITATQGGDKRFAQAAPVTKTWAYGKLVITLAWTSATTELRYNASDPVVTLTARATAIHPFPTLATYAGVVAAASNSCSSATNPGVIGGNKQTSFDLTIRVTLTDPGDQVGTCQLYLNCQVDGTISYDSDLRTYKVRRS